MIYKSKLILVILFSLSLFGSEYEQWLKEQNKQYNSYKKSMDEEFASMLKKDWESFKTMSTPTPYKKPKPVVMPKIVQEIKIPKEDILKSPKVKIKLVIKKERIKSPETKLIVKKDLPKLIPSQKIKKKIKKTKLYKNFKMINFDFYSQNISIQYDKKSHFRNKSISKKMISNYWDSISKSDYKKLLQQINKITKDLNLNGWAKYQLIHKLGQNIYHNDNFANLFTWFILVKMNYDTKVGYSENKVYLLSVVNHNIYQMSFFTLNKKRYYILTPSGKSGSIGSIYTYAGDYPKANQKLSFSMKNNIKFYTNIKQNTLKFKYDNKSYAIKAQYSKDLIQFYSTFPQSSYDLYFSSEKSSALSNSILVKLKPIINGKSEIQAVNLILRFVQTAFKYKTDPQQFNYEKVMFPEETIFYPYSDCEDRSIMFSYLIKGLLGLDVVGLKYHDHLATAVAFSTKVTGDSFRYKNKRFTVTDPTYINANLGMTMPQYKNSKFEIINF